MGNYVRMTKGKLNEFKFIKVYFCWSELSEDLSKFTFIKISRYIVASSGEQVHVLQLLLDSLYSQINICICWCYISNIYVDGNEVLDLEKLKNAPVIIQEATCNSTGGVQTLVGNIVIHSQQQRMYLFIYTYINILYNISMRLYLLCKHNSQG